MVLGNVWRADGLIIKRALVTETRGKIPLGTPRTRRTLSRRIRKYFVKRFGMDMACNSEEWNKFGPQHHLKPFMMMMLARVIQRIQC